MPQEDVDLDLDSLWYIQKNPKFPPPTITSLGVTSSAITHRARRESSQQKVFRHYIVAMVRWIVDLSVSQFDLRWDSNHPRSSLQVIRTHYPPPRPLSDAALAAAGDKYGWRLVRWAKTQLGQQVGDGSSLAFAREGLLAINKANRLTRAHEPVFVTEGRVHGYCFGEHIMPTGTWIKPGMQPKAGDIIEFKDAAFVTKVRDGTGKALVQKTVERKEHTAIFLTSLGTTVRVLQQGAEGRNQVEKGDYDFVEMVQGKMVFYRPVGRTWAPPLEARH